MIVPVQAYCANAAGENGPGENGWVSLEEWEAMPEGLKPLMAHRCHALGWDVTQQGVRDRGACLHIPMMFAWILCTCSCWLYHNARQSGLHFPCSGCFVMIASFEPSDTAFGYSGGGKAAQRVRI